MAVFAKDGIEIRNLLRASPPLVEPKEEIQIDFTGPLPDELNRDTYILVAIDKWSKFPTAKRVRNTTADVAINLCKDTFSTTGYLGG